MTTVLQRVANTLGCRYTNSQEPNRYTIADIREGPSGGQVTFIDPRTQGTDWTGPRTFGIVHFTIEEIRTFTSTQISHRIREAEAKLLKDLSKVGISAFLTTAVLFSASSILS